MSITRYDNVFCPMKPTFAIALLVILAGILSSCRAPGAVKMQAPDPAREEKMLVYVEPFRMWKGTEKHEWMASAMSEFFLHGWRRKAIAAPSAQDARHNLVGEYWVKGNEIRINARLTRGIRTVGEYHWEGAADSSSVVPLWVSMVRDVNETLKEEGYPLR